MAIIYFHLPVELLILGAVEYAFGGMSAFLGNCFAYIADYVPKEKRAMRMVYLDAMIFLNGAVSHLVVGFWIKWQGYFDPFYFVLGGKVLTLLYAIFFIPETVPKYSSEREGSACKNIFHDLKNGVQLFTKDDGSNRRWQLLTMLLAYLVPQLISTYSITTLFEMNAPLCWNSVKIGYYGVIRDIIPCIFLVISALVLKRLVPIEWQAVIGLTSDFAKNLYFAFVTSTIMMYFGKFFFVTLNLFSKNILFTLIQRQLCIVNACDSFSSSCWVCIVFVRSHDPSEDVRTYSLGRTGYVSIIFLPLFRKKLP